MIDKLNALEQKFEELNVLMADPAVIANTTIYQKHAKAHRDLPQQTDRGVRGDDAPRTRFRRLRSVRSFSPNRCIKDASAHSRFS